MLDSNEMEVRNTNSPKSMTENGRLPIRHMLINGRTNPLATSLGIKKPPSHQLIKTPKQINPIIRILKKRLTSST